MDHYYAMYVQYHGFFYDAPLDLLVGGNTVTHHMLENGQQQTVLSHQAYHNIDSSYVSVSFSKAIGSVCTGFSSKQLATLREQIEMANLSGL